MKHFAIPSLSRLAIVLCCALGANVSLVSAASQCKGIDQNACAANGGCRWVDGYTRKDGRSVSAHCRLNRSGKAPGQASAGSVKLSTSDH